MKPPAESASAHKDKAQLPGHVEVDSDGQIRRHLMRPAM
jgi:hypothetical protein